MATYENLGPATITIGTAPGTNFSGEFLGVKIVHNYEDIGESRVMLDGSERPSSKRRTDGVTGSLENDLTAAGLYVYLQTNDLTEADCVIEQTETGSTWTGKVQLALPAEIGADEFGSPIVSDIEWDAVGTFAFTPAGP